MTSLTHGPAHGPIPTKSLFPRGRPIASQTPLASLPSSDAYLNILQSMRTEWYRAKTTTQAYKDYVRRGIEWLIKWSNNGGTLQVTDGSGEDISIPNAFDIINSYTPIALLLHLVHKCGISGSGEAEVPGVEGEGHGYSTAAGIHAAFKDYFANVHKRHEDFWRYNSHTREWEGNPACAPDIKEFVNIVKNRDIKTHGRNPALAIFPKDIKAAFVFLDSEEGLQQYTETQRLLFKAFVTNAFMLMGRYDDIMTMKRGTVVEAEDEDGTPYHLHTLHRKKTQKDPALARKMRVPRRDQTELDAYTHLKNWLAHLEKCLQRPLQAKDLIFPMVSNAGKIDVSKSINQNTWKSLFAPIYKRSGFVAVKGDTFGTHGHRRGSAQFWFMHAPVCLSLKALKWWGGWSPSERVQTIVQYLLDELASEEESFETIFMPSRRVDRQAIFGGLGSASSWCSEQPSPSDGLRLEAMESRIEHLTDAISKLTDTILTGNQARHTKSVNSNSAKQRTQSSIEADVSPNSLKRARSTQDVNDIAMQDSDAEEYDAESSSLQDCHSYPALGNDQSSMELDSLAHRSGSTNQEVLATGSCHLTPLVAASLPRTPFSSPTSPSHFSSSPSITSPHNASQLATMHGATLPSGFFSSSRGSSLMDSVASPSAKTHPATPPFTIQPFRLPPSTISLATIPPISVAPTRSNHSLQTIITTAPVPASCTTSTASGDHDGEPRGVLCRLTDWRELFKAWEHGHSVKTGVILPLRLWEQRFKGEIDAADKKKLSNIKIMFEEFRDIYNSNVDTFAQAFTRLKDVQRNGQTLQEPQEDGWSSILVQVRAARRLRGTSRERPGAQKAVRGVRILEFAGVSKGKPGRGR